jgi:SlyX protein
MNPADKEQELASQLVSLEEKLSFQQRQLDQLNSVILEQQAELERQRRDLSELTTTLKSVIESSGSDLPHEKPPHY